MRVHFIAIGGSAMHGLAIEAKRLGWVVSGSDDEIYEPSSARLSAAGLLPAVLGWDAQHISPALNLVVLGMHAKKDNPELAKAQELGLPVLSYPEFVYQLAQDMQRLVVAGSHGKTTITSMIMHVLRAVGRKFNYLVGASVEGFENSIRIDADAAIIVIEGDEYLASALAETPKFLQYKHHIGVVSGIAWDHINVFPTLNSYVRQFDHFADASPKGGALIFNDDDPLVSVICNKERPDVTSNPYRAHPSVIKNGQTFLITAEDNLIPVSFFGDHNMFNVQAAKEATAQLSVQPEEFYAAIQSFKGAALRLETVPAPTHTVFRDFAHAPSKVRATVAAVVAQYPTVQKAGVLELHTFSSLDPLYVAQYEESLQGLDIAAVFLDEEVLAKKGKGLDAQLVLNAFKYPGLEILHTRTQLQEFYAKHKQTPLWLWMSSGRLGGLDVQTLYA